MAHGSRSPPSGLPARFGAMWHGARSQRMGGQDFVHGQFAIMIGIESFQGLGRLGDFLGADFPILVGIQDFDDFRERGMGRRSLPRGMPRRHFLGRCGAVGRGGQTGLMTGLGKDGDPGDGANGESGHDTFGSCVHCWFIVGWLPPPPCAGVPRHRRFTLAEASFDRSAVEIGGSGAGYLRLNRAKGHRNRSLSPGRGEGRSKEGVSSKVGDSDLGMMAVLIMAAAYTTGP